MSKGHLVVAWTRLSVDLNESICEKWRNRVCELYSEPHRYYHTLIHVEDMLQMKEQYKDRLVNETSVDYAIIFHDLVYQPKCKDNEEQSVLMFTDFAKEVGLSVSVKDSVVEMIQATKYHKTSAHESDNPDAHDLHYMLDLDMAVLGQNEEGYQTYAQQIRQEYIHIPEETYCEKRAELLTSFLRIPYIYATSEFRQRFEIQARKNIKAEIDCLKKRVCKP